MEDTNYDAQLASLNRKRKGINKRDFNMIKKVLIELSTEVAELKSMIVSGGVELPKVDVDEPKEDVKELESDVIKAPEKELDTEEQPEKVEDEPTEDDEAKRLRLIKLAMDEFDEKIHHRTSLEKVEEKIVELEANKG